MSGLSQERRWAEFSARWQELTEAEMRYRGYTDEDIAEANKRTHADECQHVDPGVWDCYDEDGKSFHPVWDEMEDIAGVIERVLEAAEERERVLRAKMDGVWEAVNSWSDTGLDRVRLALVDVEAHVRTETPFGPDYCAGCSEVLGDWVQWPCRRAALTEGTQPQGEQR